MAEMAMSRRLAIGHRLRTRLGAALLLMLVSAPAQAGSPDPVVLAFLGQFSLPVVDSAAIVVCHGYGCNYRTEVAFTDADRREFARLMAPGRASAEAERKALRAAVAWFERRVGRVAGTANRTPSSAGAAGDPHEADCIDETANTTSFLLVLDLLGLLHHHAVAGPEPRGLTHMAASIRETKNGAVWVIDPWPHKNGEPPDLMPLDAWLAAE